MKNAIEFPAVAFPTLELEILQDDTFIFLLGEFNYLMGDLANKPTPPTSLSILKLRCVDPAFVKEATIEIKSLTNSSFSLSDAFSSIASIRAPYDSHSNLR